MGLLSRNYGLLFVTLAPLDTALALALSFLIALGTVLKAHFAQKFFFLHPLCFLEKTPLSQAFLQSSQRGSFSDFKRPMSLMSDRSMLSEPSSEDKELSLSVSSSVPRESPVFLPLEPYI